MCCGILTARLTDVAAACVLDVSVARNTLAQSVVPEKPAAMSCALHYAHVGRRRRAFTVNRPMLYENILIILKISIQNRLVFQSVS